MKKNEYRFAGKRAAPPRFLKKGRVHLWIGPSRRLHRAFNAVVDYRWFNFSGFELGDVKIGSDSFIIGD